MRILILGVGVIGTTYGYLFKKANHEVNHLVRNEKKNARNSTVTIHVLDGRLDKQGVEYDDTYTVEYAEPGAEYDFILISVACGKIGNAVNFIDKNNIKGTILLFCNFWNISAEIKDMMKGYPYIIGFPVAGGSLENNRLNCVVFDHIMIEQEQNTTISNYQSCMTLFESANIKLEKPFDMVQWIWLHMAINAAVTTSAIGKDTRATPSVMAENLMSHSSMLKEAVLTIRETSHIVEKRGVQLSKYRNELLPYKMPSALAGSIMKKMFTSNELTRRIMLLHNDLSDILYGVECVYETGQKLGVKAPRFYEKASEAFLLYSSIQIFIQILAEFIYLSCLPIFILFSIKDCLKKNDY